jgi:hypothetical protein
MWFKSSNTPHSAHIPLDGPCLFLICSLDGSLPLSICQRKILILVWIFDLHTTLKCIVAHLPHNWRYMELVEKHPDASRAHETPSLSSLSWVEFKSWRRLSQSITSAITKARWKPGAQRPSRLASVTKISGSEQMPKRARYKSQSGPYPATSPSKTLWFSHC